MDEPPARSRRRLVKPLSGVAALGVIVAGAATYMAVGHAATAPNPNCTLIVPANPLTAAGLATPYQLVATDAAGGPCNEANAVQSAFVQGAIISAGQITLYDPLVIDQGTQPIAPPVTPTVPAGATVALWFGFNGTNLTLQSAAGTNALQQGNCVNGAGAANIFGQFAYCNAPAWFQSANAAVQNNQLQVPPLGTAKDGLPCPTVRDFSVVDQDQSDNVLSNYLANGNGQTGQNNAATLAAVQNAAVNAQNAAQNAGQAAASAPAAAPASAAPPATTAKKRKRNAAQQNAQAAAAASMAAAQGAAAQQAKAQQAAALGMKQVVPAAAAPAAAPVNLANGSDNRLLDAFILPTLGCTPWTKPNASQDGQATSSLPLNELQAAMFQQAPIALVPLTDPMTQTNANADPAKNNLYRAGVNQTPLGAADNGNGTTYCQNLFFNAAGIQRVFKDMAILQNGATPDAATGTNLFTFLAARANASFTNLNCQNLTNMANPIQLTLNGNGVATAATFNAAGAAAGASASPAASAAAGTGTAANGAASASPAASSAAAGTGMAGTGTAASGAASASPAASAAAGAGTAANGTTGTTGQRGGRRPGR